MYIEKTARSYYRGTEQRTSSARFLILVGLGITYEEIVCRACQGTKVHAREEGGLLLPCNTCTRVPCTTCERKGWTYDEAVDEHAKQCDVCEGKGDLGASGVERRSVFNKEIRALVRRVALRQLGHFMMGTTTVRGHTLSLSGSYGGDGLTVTVPQDVFDIATPIPDWLHEEWSKGGGHNSAGSEAPKMAAWANANLDRLQREDVLAAYNVQYVHKISNPCICGHGCPDHENVNGSIYNGPCKQMKTLVDVPEGGNRVVMCDCKAYTPRIEHFHLPAAVIAEGDRKTTARALRDYKVLTRGTRLVHIKREGGRLVCFPSGATGGMWHSIIIEPAPKGDGA